MLDIHTSEDALVLKADTPGMTPHDRKVYYKHVITDLWSNCHPNCRSVMQHRGQNNCRQSRASQSNFLLSFPLQVSYDPQAFNKRPAVREARCIQRLGRPCARQTPVRLLSVRKL